MKPGRWSGDWWSIVAGYIVVARMRNTFKNDTFVISHYCLLHHCSYFIKQDKSPLGPKFPKYMGAVQLKWIITLPQPPIIDLNIHEKQLWKLN